jgi:hypothetical protein
MGKKIMWLGLLR